MTWFTATGDRLRFASDGSGGFTNPKGRYGKLTHDMTNGVYEWADVDGNTVTFDDGDDGLLLSWFDRYENGIVVNYDISESTHIATIEDAKDSTRKLTFSYNADDRIKDVSDWDSRTWQYTYTESGADGQLESTIPPNDTNTNSGTTTYTYYADTNDSARKHLLKTVADAKLRTTTYEYYANRRGFRVTDSLGAQHSFAYNPYLNRTSYIDEAGRAAEYDFNDQGNLLALRQPDNSVLEYEWVNGLRTKVVDEYGQATDYEYANPSNGKVTKVTAPLEQIREFDYTTYTLSGGLEVTDLEKITDLGGTGTDDDQITEYVYDPSLGHRKEVIRSVDSDPLTNVVLASTQFTYAGAMGPRGLPDTITLPKGVETTSDDDDYKTTFTYNTGGQVLTQDTRSEDDIPISIVNAYTDRGELENTTDGRGEITSYTYDLLGRRLTETLPDPDGPGQLEAPENRFKYDETGLLTESRLHKASDAPAAVGLRKTIFEYDKMLQLVRTNRPDGSIVSATYDSLGNTISVSDALGRRTENVYNARNQVTGTILPDGTILRTDYDGGGRVVARFDALGNTTTFKYDVLGRVVQETSDDPDQPGELDLLPEIVTKYVYDEFGNIEYVTVTDSVEDADFNDATRTTTFGYDFLNRKTSERTPDPDGASSLVALDTFWDYDKNGNIKRITTGPVGTALGDEDFTTSYEYDELNRRIKETSIDPDDMGSLPSIVTQFGYDKNSNLTQVTVAPGDAGVMLGDAEYTTDYAYDFLNRRITETLPDPDGVGVGDPLPVTTLSYDQIGNLESTTDARGNTITYTYDTLGRQVAVTTPDPDGTEGPLSPTTTGNVFDLVGNVIQTIDPVDRSTRLIYDNRNRLTDVIQPAPDELSAGQPKVTNTYDAAGNLLSTKVPSAADPANDAITTYSYDALNRVVEVTDAEGNIVTTAYDELGRIKSVTEVVVDPANPTDPTDDRVTTYQYDNLGRVTLETVKIGTDIASEIETVYDDRGNLVEQIALPNDQHVPSLTRSTWFKYDLLNRLTHTIDHEGAYDTNGGTLVAGHYVETEYDNLGRVAFVYDELRRETAYQYDNLGRTITETLPDPDGAGTQESSPITTFTYDAVGNLLTTTDPNNEVTNYEYDALNRQVTILEPSPDNSTRPRTDFAFDQSGNLASVTDPLGLTTTYTYDYLNRQTQETLADPDDVITDDSVDSDANAVTKETGAIVLGNGDSLGTVDAGLTPPTGFSTPDTTMFIDVTDPAFATYEGFWNSATSGPLDIRYRTPEVGVLGHARWTITGIPSGTYRVSTSWHTTDDSFATDAPFTLMDGFADPTPLTVLVDQDNNPPNDFNDNNIAWEDLAASFDITGDTLIIDLKDNAEGIVIAGPLRLERIGDLAPDQIEVTDTEFALVSGTWSSDPNTSVGAIKWADPNVAEESRRRWTLSNLVSGVYRISTTWHTGSSTFANDAPFTLKDGLADTSPQRITLNQEVLPNDFIDNSLTWEDLTTEFHVTGDTLLIDLDNNAEGIVVAGPLRVQRVGDLPQTLERPDFIAVTDPEFTVVSGYWSSFAYTEIGDITFKSGTAGGTGKVRWDITGLQAGTYRVSAAWHKGHNTFANNAPFTLKNGLSDPTPENVLINQELLPASLANNSIAWEDLSTGFEITGDQLVIELGNNAEGYVTAGPIRLQRIDDAESANPPQEIGGVVWWDLDEDGVQDPDEPGAAGIDITLTGAGPDGVMGTADDTTETIPSGDDTTDYNGDFVLDQDGFYWFTGLNAGEEYRVSFDETDLPSGAAFTTQDAQVIIAGPLAAPVTKYTYDLLGNLLTITDPALNTTTYTYDDLSRVDTETNQLGKVRTTTYDDLGRIEKIVDRNGRVREFDYNALDQVTEERWRDEDTDPVSLLVRTITYDYNDLGLLTDASDPDATYEYRYDTLNRLEYFSNASTPGTVTTELNYDYYADGFLKQVATTVNTAADFTNDYFYDELGRLKQVDQRGTGIADKRVDFTYTPTSRFETITRYSDLAGNAADLVAATTYAYDDLDRLTGLTHDDGAAPTPAVFADYTYAYDPAGRLIAQNTPDGYSAFTYDNNAQLLYAAHTALGSGTVPDRESYAFDANGNRTDDGGTTIDTDPDNRLDDDGTYTYTYDHEGNRATRTEIGTPNTVTYTYDHRNRLTDAVYAGNATTHVQYTYDPNDLRIATKIDDTGDGTFETVERFVLDGDDVALVLTDGTSGGGGVVTHRYLHGFSTDQVLAEETTAAATAGAATNWLLADHQNSVRDVIDNAGVSVDHIVYDSFGNITDRDDPTYDLRFAYTGRELADEAGEGTYYYRRRFYDSINGRFLNQDPIGFAAGDTNLYRYVGNSPLNFTDPTGLGSVGNGAASTIKSNRVDYTNNASTSTTSARTQTPNFISTAIETAGDYLGDLFNSAVSTFRDPVVQDTIENVAANWIYQRAFERAQRPLQAPVDQVDDFGPATIVSRRAAQYARYFQEDPVAFEWAGAAALVASDVAFAVKGLNTAQTTTISQYAGVPQFIEDVTLVSPAAVEQAFLDGNRAIYDSVAPQIEVFREFGAYGTELLARQSLIHRDMAAAWRALDQGKRSGDHSLVNEGTARIADFEQRRILGMVSARHAQTFQALTDYAASPIPGGTSFSDAMRRVGVTPDLSNPTQRSLYATEFVIPEIRSFASEERPVFDNWTPTLENAIANIIEDGQ